MAEVPLRPRRVGNAVLTTAPWWATGPNSRQARSCCERSPASHCGYTRQSGRRPPRVRRHAGYERVQYRKAPQDAPAGIRELPALDAQRTARGKPGLAAPGAAGPAEMRGSAFAMLARTNPLAGHSCELPVGGALLTVSLDVRNTLRVRVADTSLSNSKSSACTSASVRFVAKVLPVIATCSVMVEGREQTRQARHGERGRHAAGARYHHQASSRQLVGFGCAPRMCDYECLGTRTHPTFDPTGIWVTAAVDTLLPGMPNSEKSTYCIMHDAQPWWQDVRGRGWLYWCAKQ